MSNSRKPPVVQQTLMLRRPVDEVYAAFVDPYITTKFWFTKSSGVLEVGKTVTWEWEMYGASTEVVTRELEPGKRILVTWSGSNQQFMEWLFEPLGEDRTFVTVSNWGFEGAPDDVVNQALDSMGGFTFVLCAAKAYLEHGLQLNFVEDKAPQAIVEGWVERASN